MASPLQCEEADDEDIFAFCRDSSASYAPNGATASGAPPNGATTSGAPSNADTAIIEIETASGASTRESIQTAKIAFASCPEPDSTQKPIYDFSEATCLVPVKRKPKSAPTKPCVTAFNAPIPQSTSADFECKSIADQIRACMAEDPWTFESAETWTLASRRLRSLQVVSAPAPAVATLDPDAFSSQGSFKCGGISLSAEQAAQKAKADASQEARSFSLVLHIQPPKPLRETFLSSPKEEMSALPAWLHVSRPQNLHLRRCEFPSVLDGTYWIKLRDDAVRPPELESLIVSGKEPKSKRFGPAKVQDVAILHPLLKTNYNKWKSWRGVPPAWGMSAFGVPKVDARTYGIPMQPRLKLNAERQLREDQDIAVTSMVEEALVSGYAAVVLPCGSGKSAVAVAVMTHPSLAQHAGEPPPRAAFLTDQIRLMNQFEDDLRGTHGRFGWCPEARVGRIQESYTGAMAAGENTKRRRQFDVDNKDIVIISPRTLAVCNDIPQEVLDTFGTLWYDEGELCASPAMQAVLRKFKCRYRFCATATQRSDGFQCIVHWSLGANVCVMQRYAHITGKYDAARVLMVDGDAWTTIPTFTVPRWQDDKPEIDLHAYHANQSINDKRNAFLCSLVRDVLFVRGVARVMVFTQSVAHIIELETLLNAYLSFCSDALFPLTPALSALDACVCSDAKTQKQKAKIQTNKIVVAIHSDLTPAAQDAAWAAAASPACKVLIGTYKMIGRGYDDNFVDVGIFAMEPTGALPQRFGRLQRPRKDKPLPLIIQLVDRWSLIQSLASKCVAEFEKFGFSIHHVSALDLAALLKQRWTKALHCFAHNLDLLAAGQGLAQILNTAATQAFLNNKPALAIEVVNPLSAPPVKGTSECLFDEAQDL